MMVVMIQQMISIVFFRKIYQSDAQELDYYFSRLIPVVLLLSLLLWWMVPLLTYDLFALFETSFATYNGLYYILSFHCIFWISLALNENLIYRESLSSKMNKAFAIILLLMISLFVFVYYLGYLDLFSLAIINLVCLFLATDMQFYLLEKYKGIKFKNNRQINRLVLVFFILSYSLIFLL